MMFRNAIAAVSLMLLSLALSAQSQAQQLIIQCDSKAGEMNIRYRASVEPESPGVSDPSPGTQRIDFSSLVRPTVCPESGPCMITELKEAKLTCKLPGAIYRLTFKPVPGNSNRQGMCGGVISGTVEIKKNAQPFMPKTPFDTAMCSDKEDAVLEFIHIAVNKKSPELRWRKLP